MNILVIFVVISAFLVAGIYSSSTSIVVAEKNITCQPIGKSSNQWRCQVADEDTKTATNWFCEKSSNGNWTCVEIKSPKETPIPTGLKDALDKAMLAEVQANITGDLDATVLDRLNDLNEHGINEQSIENNDNNDLLNK